MRTIHPYDPGRNFAEEFGVAGPLPEFPLSYNVAPTQEVAAVLAEGGERRLQMLRWSLIPSWAYDPQIGSRMINACSETLAEKPSFRRAFREECRCLIPMDGFYEWQRTDNGKQPYYLRVKGGSPFAFAGLWEAWGKDGEEILSCTILTTEANEVVGKVHHRTPVIVTPENCEVWLDPDMREADWLMPLLVPYPSDEMEAYPVSRFVNKPSSDDERCVEPVA